jgi:spermidine/putrescine transport system ATP-binding protein
VGTTFLFVTHDQEEALVMADRIVVMREGALEQVGTAREIYDAPVTPFVADFVGELNWLDANASSGAAILSDGAQIKLPEASQHRRGPVRIGFRPERMRLAPIDAVIGPQDNGVRATITSVTFQGPITTVDLRLTDGMIVRCQSSATDTIELPEKGGTVLCLWQIGSTLVFDASPTEQT